MAKTNIEVGGKIIAGRRIEGGGSVGGETLKGGAAIPEGAKVSGDLVFGGMRDADSTWELFVKDNGRAHRTSEGRYVYVLDSNSCGGKHIGEKLMDDSPIPNNSIVLSRFSLNGFRDSDGILWQLLKGVTTTVGRFVYQKEV